VLGSAAKERFAASGKSRRSARTNLMGSVWILHVWLC
jgi:hypothetical protein